MCDDDDFYWRDTWCLVKSVTALSWRGWRVVVRVMSDV